MPAQAQQGQSQGVLTGKALLGVAVTHLHPGAGRSPGIVDLPVVKDSMGYPLVPASSVKGALKTRCARIEQADLSNGTIKCFDEKKICIKGSLCCCLFGGEAGEGPKGSGVITVLDLVPIAFPVASADQGFVYVAPKSLLARAAAIFSAVGGSDYAKLFTKLSQAPSEAAGVNINNKVYIFTSPVELKPAPIDGDANILDGLASTLREIHPLALNLKERLVILDDSLASKVVERALLRVTRVRLDKRTKTVELGGLWTEEYIPQGTIFVSAIIATGYTNEFCKKCNHCSSPEDCLDKALNKLGLQQGLPVFVGGKETVGKGLIVFKPLT